MQCVLPSVCASHCVLAPDLCVNVTRIFRHALEVAEGDLAGLVVIEEAEGFEDFLSRVL